MKKDIEMYFNILGIPVTASHDEARQKFKALEREAMSTLYPEDRQNPVYRNMSEDEFKRIYNRFEKVKEAWEKVETHFIVREAIHDNRDTTRHSQYSAENVVKLFEDSFQNAAKGKYKKQVNNFLSLAREVLQRNGQQGSHPFKTFYELQALYSAMETFANKEGKKAQELQDALKLVENSVRENVNLNNALRNANKSSAVVLGCYPFEARSQLSLREIEMSGDPATMGKNFTLVKPSYIAGGEVDLTARKFKPVSKEMLDKIIVNCGVSTSPEAQRVISSDNKKGVHEGQQLTGNENRQPSSGVNKESVQTGTQRTWAKGEGPSKSVHLRMTEVAPNNATHSEKPTNQRAITIGQRPPSPTRRS